MKQTIIILLAIIALSFSTVWAEDENEASSSEPNYKVTIKIVYNSISESESNRIERTIKAIHSKACEVEISSKKLEYNGDWHIFSSEITTFRDAIQKAQERQYKAEYDRNGGGSDTE